MALHTASRPSQRAIRRVTNNAVTHIRGIFAEHHLDDDEMTARAFAFHIETVERIERMIAGVDARRNRVTTELDRYRDGDRRRSRMITDDVTDID